MIVLLAIVTLGLGGLLAAGVLRRRTGAAESLPAVLAVERIELGGTEIRLANLLDADDACATAGLAERLLAAGLIRPPVLAIVSCRPDRIVRSKQSARLLPRLAAEQAFVIGHPTRSAIAEIPAGWPGAVVDLGRDLPLDEVLQAILTRIGTEASLVALGSPGGVADALLDQLRALGAQA
jgi:hypothetical protein